MRFEDSVCYHLNISINNLAKLLNDVAMAQSIQTCDNQINYILFYASLKLKMETCSKLIEVHKTCRIAHSYLTSGQYKQTIKQTQTNNCKHINTCCSKVTLHSLAHLVSFYRHSTTYSCLLAGVWPLCIVCLLTWVLQPGVVYCTHSIMKGKIYVYF